MHWRQKTGGRLFLLLSWLFLFDVKYFDVNAIYSLKRRQKQTKQTFSRLFISKMAKKCCVPGCKANYFSKETEEKKEDGNKENSAPNVSVYLFPADLNGKLRWIAVILRVTQERVLALKDPVICSNHWPDNFKSATRERSSTGTTVNFQRGTTQRFAHTSTQPKTNCQVICRREKC